MGISSEYVTEAYVEYFDLSYEEKMLRTKTYTEKTKRNSQCRTFSCTRESSFGLGKEYVFYLHLSCNNVGLLFS